MGLQTTGTIGHSEIMAEFGKTGAFDLSAGGAPLINKSPSNLINETDFYGQSATLPVTITPNSGRSGGGRSTSLGPASKPSTYTANISQSFFTGRLVISHAGWSSDNYAPGTSRWRPVHSSSVKGDGIYQTNETYANSIESVGADMSGTDNGSTTFIVDAPFKKVTRIYSFELTSASSQTCTKRASAPAANSNEGIIDVVTAVGPGKYSGNVPSTPTGFQTLSSGAMDKSGYIRTWVDLSGSNENFSISNSGGYPIIRGWRIYVSE